MRKFLVILVTVTAFIVGWGVVAAIFGTPTAPSDQAVYNTSKNAFISACAEKSNQLKCTCAWNALDNYYKNTGDTQWYSDTYLVNRIKTQGYNQNETDVIVSCVQ